MTFMYIISISMFFGLFILFLVIGKSMNSIMNHLLKIEYLFEKEFEFRKEEQEIQRMLREKLAERERRPATEEDDEGA